MDEIQTISVGTLIPSNELMELIYLRDTLSASYWRIGDIVNHIYALGLANGYKIEHKSIYTAVGEVIGKSARSVRLYATVAAFFSPDTRLAYEVLPFSHFTFAASLEGERAGIPMWQVALDTSLSTIDNKGFPAGVESISKMFFCAEHTIAVTSELKNLIPPIVEAEWNTFDNIDIGDNEDIIQPDFDEVVSVEQLQTVCRQINSVLNPLPLLIDKLVKLDGSYSLAQEIMTVKVMIEEITQRLRDKSGQNVYAEFFEETFA